MIFTLVPCFWPVKSASLVVSEEMVRCYEICCYVLLYFGDLLWLWECIVARIRENESPRLLATYIVDLLTSINVDLWAIATRVLPYESADLARGAVCLGVPPLSGLSVGFGSIFVRGPLLVCWRLGVVLMDGGAFRWLLSVVACLGFSGVFWDCFALSAPETTHTSTNKKQRKSAPLVTKPCSSTRTKDKSFRVIRL